MPTGFAIIGCGMIAHFHARAIRELRDARLVAVQTSKPEHGRSVAEAYGEDVAICDTVEELLARDDVQVVNICTPSGAHMEPAVAAARAGKHVVVEKPLEVTLARCDAIIGACRAAGVQLACIFQSRFSEANRALKRAIDAGRFGRLTLGDTYVKWWRSQEYYDSGAWRGTWKLDGGGALMNQAIHNVDLLYWLMGDVDQICGATARLAHERIEVEDTAVAALRFKSGALGVIEAATSVYPGLLKRTEIHGDRGTAIVEQDDITRWDFAEVADEDGTIREHFGLGGTAGLSSSTRSTGGAADPKAISHAGHKAQLEDFLASIRERRPPIVDGAEGRKSVEIILAIYEASRTGRAVNLPLGHDPERA